MAATKRGWITTQSQVRLVVDWHVVEAVVAGAVGVDLRQGETEDLQQLTGVPSSTGSR
jgi:hypothetical protein